MRMLGIILADWLYYKQLFRNYGRGLRSDGATILFDKAVGQ
jgi:hypothetical protein